MNNPEDVHLISDKLRAGFRKQQIEKRALPVRLKLVSVRMIKKLYAAFGQRFAGAIKHRNGVAAGLLVEVTSVRYPGATGILQTKRLGVAGDALDIVAYTFVREMAS